MPGRGVSGMTNGWSSWPGDAWPETVRVEARVTRRVVESDMMNCGKNRATDGSGRNDCN